MPFTISERKALLSVKGVGPTVIARLEQMGIESLAHLKNANALDIVSNASAIVGSNCWKIVRKLDRQFKGQSNWRNHII